jgi:hypothetical protein
METRKHLTALEVDKLVAAMKGAAPLLFGPGLVGLAAMKVAV